MTNNNFIEVANICKTRILINAVVIPMDRITHDFLSDIVQRDKT